MVPRHSSLDMNPSEPLPEHLLCRETLREARIFPSWDAVFTGLPATQSLE